MNCPICNHPVVKHDIFCEVPNCYCNTSMATADAKARLKIAIDGLVWIRDLFVENGEFNETTEKVNEILTEIDYPTTLTDALPSV